MGNVLVETPYKVQFCVALRSPELWVARHNKHHRQCHHNDQAFTQAFWAW